MDIFDRVGYGGVMEDGGTGWRGSREGWLEAALAALVSGGVEAVKILPLAQKLKLSRTSFYWFFRDREALLAALAEVWEARTTAGLVAAAGGYAESEAEAMLGIIGCFLDAAAFDSRLEFAVRAWAMQDAGIMARVRAADAVRLAAIRALLERWGHGAVDADVRARTVYLVQIGYISMQSEETLAERMARIPSYVEIYCGVRPEAREMARFQARHGAGQGA